MVEEIDLGLRAANIAMMSLGIMILLRDAGRTHIGRLGALFLFGAVAYVISSSPHFLDNPASWTLPWLAIGIPNIVFFWMFGRALFEDDYRPTWIEPVAVGVLVILGFARLMTWGWMPDIPHGLMKYVPQIAKLAMVGHVVWLAFQGRADDLVEQRRRFRLPFIAVIATFAGTVLFAEFLIPLEGPPIGIHILNMGALLAVSFFTLLWLVRLRSDELVGALIPSQPIVAEPAPPRLPPREQAMLDALTHAMEVEDLFLREDLTIGALAQHLQAQEHVLRRLINQELGHRNFAQFLNRYRLARAKADLMDPNKAHLPILSIAHGVGYGSIGPFNRAFKDETGQTPSQFRKSGRL